MSIKKISFVEIFLWTLVFLLILISLTPVALGFKVKSDFHSLVEQASTFYQMDIEVQDYSQGAYSSDATLVIRMPELNDSIKIHHEIIHGPVYTGLISQGRSPFVVAVTRGELIANAGQKSFLQGVFPDSKPVMTQEIIGFSGNVDSQVYIPAFDTQFDTETGPVRVQFSGMVIDQHYNTTTQDFEGEAQSNALSITMMETEVRFDSILSSFSGNIGKSSLLMGESAVNIGSIKTTTSTDSMTLNTINLTSNTAESGPVVNTKALFSVQEILTPKQKYGPLNFILSLNGLDAASLNQLNELQDSVKQQVEQGIPEEQASAMMIGQLMGLIPELIRKAEFKISPFKLDSDLGSIETTVNFRLEGLDENTPADPAFLISAIRLNVDMGIDNLLLRHFVSMQVQSSMADSPDSMTAEDLDIQVDDVIKGMLVSQFLAQDEDRYVTRINMQQGVMLINGMTVDPMQQLMSAMGNSPQ